MSRPLLVFAIGCFGLLAHAWPAAAQVKPKIYILFDTSGSMTQDTANNFQTGDGSAICGGDGKSSRIYQLKVALFEALQGMGASEVDFALATFPMFVDPMRTPYCGRGTRIPCNNDSDCTARAGQFCAGSGGNKRCESTCSVTPACSGHYYTTTAGISEQYPGSAACAWNSLECPRYACKISTHDATNQHAANCASAACPWYAGYKTEVLQVPFGAAPEQVMFYFDQQEDAGQVAQLQNPEVRAGNGFYTPLGKSLFYAHGYFHKEIALPASDYRKKCERLVIAFFTDGVETCNDQSSDFYYPPKWATQLNQNLGVTTHTIAIDVNSPLLTDIASAGKGTAFNVAGTTAELKKAFLDIIGKSLPPAEQCNGEDDDCDNLIDEDFGQLGKPCTNGKVGACFRSGVYVCDGLDAVKCNAANGGNGTAEVCNGIDDDCDGAVDEGLNCPICPAQPEICNDKDDDCDGQVDEGITSTACGSDVGECTPGLAECKPGGQLVCSGGVGPAEEACDGLDNDCDGIRDGMFEPCYPHATGCDVASGVCKGQCKLGNRLCTATQQADGSWTGDWGACTGDVGPEPEQCDGIDNNCDGQVDEQAECPGGSQCIEGQCSQPCAGGEFVCPAGQLCINDWCILDPCDPLACDAQDGVCRAGECVNLCEGVSCPSKFELCVRGSCVDQSCFNPNNACPKGQRCLDGECQADACAIVACDPTSEFCYDGTCLKLCDRISCPDGQRCALLTDGDTPRTACVADACVGVPCGPGFVCIDGRCTVDPCEATPCDKHQICLAGECVDDPCARTACPDGYNCRGGACIVIAGTTEVLATGAGGCACDQAHSPAKPPAAPISTMLVLLAAALLERVRRAARRGRRRS